MARRRGVIERLRWAVLRAVWRAAAGGAENDVHAIAEMFPALRGKTVVIPVIDVQRAVDLARLHGGQGLYIPSVVRRPGPFPGGRR